MSFIVAMTFILSLFGVTFSNWWLSVWINAGGAFFPCEDADGTVTTVPGTIINCTIAVDICFFKLCFFFQSHYIGFNILILGTILDSTFAFVGYLSNNLKLISVDIRALDRFPKMFWKLDSSD